MIANEIPGILGVIGVDAEQQAAVATAVRDKLNEVTLVERLANVAEVHYGVQPNIVEIRASLGKYTVEGGKSLNIQVLAHNDLENKLKMAMIGTGAVTIRGLQADIEANPSRQDTPLDDHPDQLTLDDVPAENLDLDGEPTYEPVDGGGVSLDDSEIIVEAFGEDFIAHGPGYVNPHDSVHAISDTQDGAIQAFRARWADFSRGVTVTLEEDGRYMAEGPPDSDGSCELAFGQTKEDAINELMRQLNELLSEQEDEDPDITVVEDGDQFMAHGPDFVNQQESTVGFGPTREAAIASYKEDLRLREIAIQGNGKKRRKKKEDAEANVAA
jgi:hypothetical protein